MALQRFGRQPGDANQQVHLHPTDTDSKPHSRHYLCPNRHLPQSVTLLYLNITKTSICWLDRHIHMHLFPVLNVLLLMHLPGIASTMQSVIQIC
jgi:hypothetical protein